MTLKEFFRRVRRDRTWRVVNGQVRCADGLCPMAALVHKKFHWCGVIGFDEAVRILGLSRINAVRIGRAADMAGHPHRNWLLKNLGVPRQGAPK